MPGNAIAAICEAFLAKNLCKLWTLSKKKKITATKQLSLLPITDFV